MYCGLESSYDEKLNKLRSCLCADILDFKNISRQIDEISKYQNYENLSYMNSLLYPEKARGCKIPSQISVPSCSFQLRTTLDLNVPSSGTFMALFNPFFLANSENEGNLFNEVYTNGFYIGSKMTSFWKNDGSKFDDLIWYPTFFNQVIPSVYNQYRLVSASLKVKYVGALSEVCGTIGCGIWTTPISYIGGFIQPRVPSDHYDPGSAVMPTTGLFGDLSIENIRHCMYFTENPLLEGFRALYFPLDNSYLEFIKIFDRSSFDISYVDDNMSWERKRVCLGTDKSIYQSGFNWVFFVDGAPKSKKCLSMEAVCNFECLPSPEVLQYMPVTNNNLFDFQEDIGLAISAVRNKSLSSLIAK